jgi:predicted PurR-regulated permease PerM
MLHGREYMGMALRLTGDREARYRALVIDINRAVAKYMLGNVAISGLATVATWLVLTLLGVPYALSLGLLVGVFDLIPLVGATLGAIFVAIATATVDFPPRRSCGSRSSSSTSASRTRSSSRSSTAAR